jgi:D-arabinose 5-phosphate isomerase GutQ
MRGRINVEGDHVTLSALIDYRRQLLQAKRIVIVACGTSWHAGLIGKQLFETFCRIPCEVEYASEFRYRNPVVTKDDVVIAISQSGETADTLAAIEQARRAGAFVFGVCNAIGASIPRQTQTGVYIHVGPEIGVASTKAFTGHTTSASGSIEAVFCLLALQEGFIPANLNWTTADPACITPYRGGEASCPAPTGHLPLKHILCNAFGFGGNDSSLLFSR